MSQRRVAVIGAGPGGLAAAMLLSGQGYQVTVYEKQAYLGGRTSKLQLGDYTFDRGPTFFMHPVILEDIFKKVGKNLHDYVDLIKLDPLYRLQFGDLQFEPSTDQQKTAELIEQLFPGNGDGYRRFMKEEGKKFDVVAPLLQRSFGKVSDYVALDVMAALPRLNAIESVYDRLSTYFNDERLKYAFTFQAKYLGMSPWECPGTFTILSYLEHKFGLYHPIGGVNQLCTAMATVIEELGGHIHLSTPVKHIVVKKGKATGILLADGTIVDYDHVVINADFGSAMEQLFDPNDLRKHQPKKVAKRKFSCSAFMLYLGINQEVDLPHHTIYFAEDYKKNVQEIMVDQVLSPDASLYVHNPCAIDKTLAPAGKTALYVLMPCPNLQSDIDWQTETASIREQMMSKLEKIPGLENIRTTIEVEHTLTPLGWKEENDVYMGATFNLAHSLDQMMLLRPHNKFEDVERCWLVGGGTHPGSGLPTIFSSAQISTDLLIAQDQKQVVRA